MKSAIKNEKGKLAYLSVLVIILMLTNLSGQNLDLNFGFTSMQLIPASYTPAPVPIRSDAKIVATDSHLFYIGTNNKICEYWNGGGGTWSGGQQLVWTNTFFVQTNTQICNNGNEIFFVRKSDDKICRLYWSAGNWYESAIRTDYIPPSLRVRQGTSLIYNNNTIYYVGQNNQICYTYRATQGTSFNFPSVLNAQPIDVLPNTDILYVAGNQTTAHIYYIGKNNRIYDIFKNSNAWTASTNSLASNVSLPAVRSGSQLTNDGNQIFYVGADDKIYELHWENNVTGWTGSLIMPINVELAKNPSQITYFDNHIYYIGANSKISDLFRGTSWTGATIGTATILNNSSFSVFKGTTGHNIFSIGTDNRIKITLWDDVDCKFNADPNYCNFPSCQGQTWHNGGLNITSNTVTSTSNIAIPIDPFNPTNTPKSFYFIGSNGYANVFLRPVLNDINKPGWILKRDDEFSSLSTTQGLWDSQGPWSHGM